jgi:hypothetical protein
MRWIKSLVFSAAILTVTMSFAAPEKKPWIPEKGFVPDSQTAIRIAEAVCAPIYGEKQIATEKPFRAVLRDDTWVVSGTLPPGLDGGTAVAEISKRDGRILRVSHGQ